MLTHFTFLPTSSPLPLADGYLKISDFGVSKIVADTDGVCLATSGTHGYLAPEIYSKTDPRGPHAHDSSVDWFALGVTLHEFLLGVRPFDASFLRSVGSATKPAHHVHCLSLLTRDPATSTMCKLFVSGLLQLNSECRTGALGFQDVQMQPWIESYAHKAKVIARELVPSYLPDVNNSCGVGSFANPSEVKAAEAAMAASAAVPDSEFAFFAFNNSLRRPAESRESITPFLTPSPSPSVIGSPPVQSRSREGSQGRTPSLTRLQPPSESSCKTNLLQTSSLLAKSLPSCIFDLAAAQSPMVAEDEADALAMSRLKVRVSAKVRGCFNPPDSKELIALKRSDGNRHADQEADVPVWQMAQHLKSSASCNTP